MKKHIRLIVIVTVAALIIGLLLWRFWPHAFSYIFPLEVDKITSFDVWIPIENSDLSHRLSGWHADPSWDETLPALQDVLDILAASDYNEDIRNLIPSPDIRAGIGEPGTINMIYSTRGRDPKFAQFQFLDSSTVIVTYSSDGMFFIYHLTNPETYDKLVEYIKTHGTIG